MIIIEEIMSAQRKSLEHLGNLLGISLVTRAVFLGLKPFTKTGRMLSSGQATKELNSIEVREQFPNLSESVNRRVFRTSIDNLTKDADLLDIGEIINWSSIAKEVGIDSIDAMDTALRTNIGALRKEFERPDLAQNLVNYCNENNIYMPTEGCYDGHTKKKIWASHLKKPLNTLWAVDEFIEKKKELNTIELSQQEFCERIAYKDYFLLDTGGNVLWSIGWDDFFYLVDGNQEFVEQLVAEQNLEGIWIDRSPPHFV